MAVYVARVDKQGNEISRRYLPIHSYGRVHYPIRTYIRRLEYKGTENSWSSSSDAEEVFDSISVVQSQSPLSDLSSKRSGHPHKGKVNNGSASEASLSCICDTDDNISIQPETTKNENSCSSDRKSKSGNNEPSKLSYDVWLAEKKKQNSKMIAKRKEAEKRQKEETEKRKKLAEKKYQEWLESKVNQQTRKHEHQQPKGQQQVQKSETNSKIDLPPEEVERRLVLWEKLKLSEMQEHRKQLQMEKQRRLEVDLRRKEANEQAWREWQANSGNKPKPVPLNCGLLSLRSTVSDIYVNPNEWKSILDDDKTDKTADKANKSERNGSN